MPFSGNLSIINPKRVKISQSKNRPRVNKEVRITNSFSEMFLFVTLNSARLIRNRTAKVNASHVANAWRRANSFGKALRSRSLINLKSCHSLREARKGLTQEMNSRNRLHIADEWLRGRGRGETINRIRSGMKLIRGKNYYSGRLLTLLKGISGGSKSYTTYKIVNLLKFWHEKSQYNI